MPDIKAVLLGDSGVGKTALAHHAATGRCAASPAPTIGAAHSDVCITTGDGRVAHFSVWDTAGQDQYRNVVPMYFRGAAVALVVFDLTRRATFANVREWVELLERHVGACRVALVGNKADLPERALSADEAEALRRDIGADCYFETSAVTGQNVEAVLIALADALAADALTAGPAPPGVALPDAAAGGARGCC
jgi:small GTP-binding protein